MRTEFRIISATRDKIIIYRIQIKRRDKEWEMVNYRMVYPPTAQQQAAFNSDVFRGPVDFAEIEEVNDVMARLKAEIACSELKEDERQLGKDADQLGLWKDLEGNAVSLL